MRPRLFERECSFENCASRFGSMSDVGFSTRQSGAQPPRYCIVMAFWNAGRFSMRPRWPSRPAERPRHAGSYGFFSMLFLDIFKTAFLGKNGMTQPSAKFNEGSLIFTRSPFSMAS